MFDAEQRAMLALQLAPGLGPRRTADLLSSFGSAEAVLLANSSELRSIPGIGPKLVTALRAHLDNVDVDAECQRIEKAGVHLLTSTSDEYPDLLKTIPDPPPLLYVRGEITSQDDLSVAIVGSRHCSDYGKRITKRLATDLARAGITVVSGLARGIDGIAHRAALEAGGRTLAVLANGLSRIYPPEHRSLATDVRQAGAVLTENSMQEAPLKELFPARNRIISGLSRAVVIVEAAAKSGTLITATHTAEQGRSMLAVPGPIDSTGSDGTNALIRQGAVLCRGIDDILEEIHGVSVMAQREKQAEANVALPERKAPTDLDPIQKSIWDFLQEGDRSPDEMAQALGSSVPELTTALMKMEMKRLVTRLPGNRYSRNS